MGRRCSTGEATEPALPQDKGEEVPIEAGVGCRAKVEVCPRTAGVMED